MGDAASGLDANREFHLALVAASGNRHFDHFAEMLWVSRISVAIYTAQASEAGRRRRLGGRARAILAAITAADGDRAEHLTRAHLERHPPLR